MISHSSSWKMNVPKCPFPFSAFPHWPGDWPSTAKIASSWTIFWLLLHLLSNRLTCTLTLTHAHRSIFDTILPVLVWSRNTDLFLGDLVRTIFGHWWSWSLENMSSVQGWVPSSAFDQEKEHCVSIFVETWVKDIFQSQTRTCSPKFKEI